MRLEVHPCSSDGFISSEKQTGQSALVGSPKTHSAHLFTDDLDRNSPRAEGGYYTSPLSKTIAVKINYMMVKR
ncbi:MAG: hypothetical protein ACO3NK_06185 [Prochlorotrichaceae cyanobacterium]